MKQQQSRLQTLQKQTSLQVKEFLSLYKINPCNILIQHYEHNCYKYHSRQDRRRNPYNGYILKYYPNKDFCNCQIENCEKFHNIYQRQFHPFNYKTKICGNFSCQGGFLCPNLHSNQYNLLLKHQFFRFDLNTFKTQICQINHPSNYEYASCRFYHGQSDRRRHPLHYNYTYVQCTLKENCRKNQCEYAHNKIQQLYHPQRYKSKYCSKTLNNKNCEYDSFCSFAHHDREITIELLHQLSDDDQFKCFKFKTVWCPYTQQHQRNHCVYAHNFNDFRRDPIQFNYEPIDCSNWSKKTIDSLQYCGCEKRMNCQKSHGWYQSKYHPETMYKHDNQLKNILIKKYKKSKENFNKQEQQFGTGAPFFKIEDKNYKSKESQKNKEIKGQGNQQEDKKIDKGLERVQQIREEKQMKEGKDFKKNQMKKQIKRLNLWLFGYEQNLWRQMTETNPESMKEKEKSEEHFKRKYYQPKNNSKKKISKTEIVYSSSLKHMLSIIGLQQKLTGLRVPQRKLIALQEDQINSIEKLTPVQRKKLHNCIYEYVKQKKLDSIQYSKSLKQFFKDQNCGPVLQKLKIKKIPQQKILNLTPDSINELSFLGEQQKQKLPIIVENYEDDRAFKQIIMLIEEQTKQST